MKRLLLFDVDGTLVDVVGAGRVALRGAMDRVYGRAGRLDEVDFRGRTDPSIVRSALRAAGLEDPEIDAGLPELWDVYPRRLEAALADREGDLRPHPGVPELLRRLEADPRFELALVTGNVRDGAWRKLEACGVRAPFRFGAFGSDSERREDLPPLAVRRAEERLGRIYRREAVWVIGDTPEDVRCGRRTGHRTLAVATGGYGVEELRGHGADRVVPSLAGHDDLVRSLAA